MVPVLAALALIAASDSHAVAVKPAPAAATDQRQDDADRVVCRSQPITGSRFIKRVCLTRGQWDALQKQSEEYWSRLSSQAGLGMPAEPRQMNQPY